MYDYSIDSIMTPSQKEIIKRYINEVLEAFIAYLIFKIVTKSKIDILEVIRTSLIIGMITLALETYNPVYKTVAKNGIISAMAGKIIKTSS